MHTKFENELSTNEEILWTGQPNDSMHFTKSDLFFIPVSILWLAICFWMRSTANTAGLSNILLDLVFPAVGLYYLFGRFILKNYRKKKTYYAVTNKRAIVVSEAFAREVTSYFFDHTSKIRKSLRANGHGTLQFGESDWRADFQGNTGLDISNNTSVNFYDIPDIEAVHKLIADLIANQ